MRHRLSARDRERGISVLLAMLVLTALGTLSMLTVLGVRSSMQATSNDRFHTIAQYAAESGASAAIVFLRANTNDTTKWSAYVDPVPVGTQPVYAARFESGIFGNGKLPGDVANPFSASLTAYYEVSIYNNRGDSGLVAGNDNDYRVVIRSTGHGPDGALAIIEWEVSMAAVPVGTPCQVYAQESQSEGNAGTNNCIGTVDTSVTASFTPN